MAKISEPQRHAMNVVAHTIMARDLDKNVFQKQCGKTGFYDFWLKEQKAPDRALIAEFEKLCRQAHTEMVRLLEEDLKK